MLRRASCLNNFSKSSSIVSGLFSSSAINTTAARFATTLTVREALNSAILEEMDRDKTVLIVGEEVGIKETEFSLLYVRLMGDH
jgi:hypothetical protein